MDADGTIIVSVLPDGRPRTFITRDEKKFESATITDRNADRITISNYMGTKTIQLENLPANIQKELGYKTLEQTREEQADVAIAKARLEKVPAAPGSPQSRLVKPGVPNGNLVSLPA